LNDGRVLIVGGQLNNSSANATNQVEIYDPGSGLLTHLGALNIPRQSHAATLLQDGKTVLITGGYSQTQGDAVNTAEIIDTGSGQISLLQSHMTAARYGHSATLLGNGKVLIVGGYSFAAGELTSAELFDPSGTFTSTSPLTVAAGLGHSATWIPDPTDPNKPGRVLIAGGIYHAGVSPSASGTAELYDGDSGTFSQTGSLTTARFFHTATTLQSNGPANGTILFTGGQIDSNGTPTSDVEVYDPQSGTFSPSPAGPLNIPRDAHTATQLGVGGPVIIVGGVVSTVIPADISTLLPTSSVEFYPVP
jgi:hypothetical protein